MGPVQDTMLGETLYEGPETCVRRAVHGASGDRLVVKLPVLNPPSVRTVGRLVHEHHILGKLVDVAGVARSRSLELQGGQAALWLEDPGLRSLDRILAERRQLPLEGALRLALALGRVLAGVHAAGVVHKDIKPQNLLVDEDLTRIVLIDFGIASELGLEATEAGLPEALEGTLAYVSPEQTGRTGRGVDARTDLYSLGVLLFEALAGRRPFLETDPLALVHAHLAKAAPALERLVPGLPDPVARIVARCLVKHPEQRYQTARGLVVDLERVLQSLMEKRPIAAFVPGQRDFSPRLRIPETLVSREQESQAIAAAFERAAAGAVEMMLLGGPSGAGKTALVRSVYRGIAQAGHGLLLSGKHDQLGRLVPYAALTQAFRGLMGQLAASPKPVFEAWRARLEQALGPLARVIADVVPELEWLMGPLPAVPVVPTEMTYNRLKLSWINFVRAVTDASPPLVLFLDDMQWVDSASLELLKTLLTDVDRKRLLVIAAYRDNEVEPGHPLWTLIEAVEASGVEAPRLRVGPLAEPAVQTWLAATLTSEPARVRPLAGALFRKTQGNPFFLGQLLLELNRQKLLRRSLEDGVWEWDQDAVERADVTENVVELMLRQVVELPEPTQALLGQAACAGHSFSLEELTVLSGLPSSQVAQALWPVLLGGLVIPSDGQYREAQALARQNREVSAGYRFLHDRVQQAFYEGIPVDQRARTHLRIGRRLEAVFEHEGGANQKLLELVRHLNLGSAALETEAERKALARRNLQAARAAKTNGSYRLQATLVEAAQQLLGEGAWPEEPGLSVELALERIEAEFMLREFGEVHRRALELLALPLPALPRLAAQELRVRAFVASGQYGEGERLGQAALAENGITYPESNEACIASAFQLMGECDAWFDRHPEGFGAMLADPSLEHILCDALETSMIFSAGLGTRPGLAALAIARNIKQATERGLLTPVTPFLLGAFANGRSAFLGKYREDLRWVRAGEQTAARLDSPFLPQCVYLGGYYSLYELPVEQTRAYYQAAVLAAMASGSFQGTSFGLFGELGYVDLWQGRPLGQIAEREQAQRAVMVRSGDALGQHVFLLIANYVAFLRGAHSRRPADAEWLSANSQSFLALGNGVVAGFARVHEAHLFLAFGAWARAHERAEEAERFRPALFGTPFVTAIPLWRGLAAAKCWSPALPEAERGALVAIVEHSLGRVRYFSEGCAENFLHQLRLLEAEHARIHGKTDEAMARYDEAIALAQRERALHIEALAAQFAAEFHLNAGRERVASVYLQDARDAYARWDALALVAHLEATYPRLLKAAFAGAPPPRAAGTGAAGDTTADATGSSVFDVNTAVRAAQTLAGELDPERVVGRLMALMLENAGAQRGALALRVGEVLSVVARLAVEGARIETGLSEPLGQSSELPTTVIQYVARTGEAVVVADARVEARFVGDPYLAAQTVRSLLGLPLTHRGRLVGVLYLEHRDISSAFPSTRIALLSVLASQAAIAVENAFLYRDLETKVADRTAEYRAAKESADRANRAKGDFLARMSHELRTPLNGILGYAQILARIPGLPERAQEGVRIIQRSGEHLLTLIDDVLDLAKIEADKMELALKDVAFSAVLRTVVNLCRVRAEQKGIEFHEESSGPLPTIVHIDEKRLLQVLLNLLGNAIKFTAQGRVTLRVQAANRVGGEWQVCFQVLDTGPGIEPDHLARIFLPFEQVGSATAREQGTGLGLSICRQIVAMMGGSLRVESEVGKGSLFEVTLAMRPGVNAPGAAASAAGEIVGYDGERRRILVVDDKADNRAVFRDLLAPLGFAVSEAASGEEALAMAAALQPDAVVMDLAMPGMDGYETTRRLRAMPELPAALVVLAASASVSQGEAEKSRSAGCQAFLPKPVQAAPLLEALGQHLGLVWVHPPGTTAASPSAAPPEAVLVPPVAALQGLLDLVRRGRLREIAEECRQIENQDRRYGPWLRQLEAFVHSFKLKELREFIERYAAPASS